LYILIYRFLDMSLRITLSMKNVSTLDDIWYLSAVTED